MIDDIVDVFAADGALAESIDGFCVRDEQVAMARVVAEALEKRQHCVIEAGTGIGKTFAYLVPAMFAGKRIIVATGTKTLQEQLFHRDLPMVTRALGRPVRVAMLKGRANYLCLHRLELAEREVATQHGRRSQLSTLATIRRWSHITQRGDIAELSMLSESDPIWTSATSTRENCIGVDCAFFQRCHVVSARREAQAADIVVVNHHLLMADLLLKEHGFGDLLPGADAIVVDEAHQLPDVAEQFLGFSISTRQLQNLHRDVALELQTQKLSSDNLQRTMGALDRALADGFDALRAERSEFSQWPRSFLDALSECGEYVRTLAEQLQEIAGDQSAFSASAQRAKELAERITILIAHDQDTNGVRWAETMRHGFSVHFAPIEVADQLRDLIEAQIASWILTSATLAVAGDFAHFLRRVGLQRAATHFFGSPFDYQQQALLYLPPKLDMPASQLHTRQVIDAALPILEASGGRAFILFTSHRALRVGADYLRSQWGIRTPYPLLVQGDAPRDQLLQRFREAGNAVLLGTGSFWEGVDVKGTALTVVVIDKLPFAVPDDPVTKARLAAIDARGGNPFFDEQIPQAVIALKQGVGRLIRDMRDFGVIVLCDRRVLSKPYGRIFLASLPPMPRTGEAATASSFLRAKLQAVGIEPSASTPASVPAL